MSSVGLSLGATMPPGPSPTHFHRSSPTSETPCPGPKALGVDEDIEMAEGDYPASGMPPNAAPTTPQSAVLRLESAPVRATAPAGLCAYEEDREEEAEEGEEVETDDQRGAGSCLFSDACTNPSSPPASRPIRSATPGAARALGSEDPAHPAQALPGPDSEVGVKDEYAEEESSCPSLPYHPHSTSERERLADSGSPDESSSESRDTLAVPTEPLYRAGEISINLAASTEVTTLEFLLPSESGGDDVAGGLGNSMLNLKLTTTGSGSVSLLASWKVWI